MIDLFTCSEFSESYHSRRDLVTGTMRARAVLFDKDLRSKVEALDRSQAVIEFALDGTILAANTNFLDAVGYRLDEVRGQSHAMLVAPAFRETEAYRAFWAALRRGEFQAGEFKRIGKDGREIWLQATYNPILDRRGKPLKVVLPRKPAAAVRDGSLGGRAARQLGRDLPPRAIRRESKARISVVDSGGAVSRARRAAIVARTALAPGRSGTHRRPAPSGTSCARGRPPGEASGSAR